MSLLNQNSLNQVTGLAETLGLNQWQIQDASWNGYKFATVSNNVFSKLSSGLGQISSVISATSNIIDSTERAFGYDAGNANTIPAGANMQSSNVTDTFTRKVAINSLPNGRDNIRSLGYNGQDIVMYAIAWGPNYIGGVKNNLLNMFYSDESLSPASPNYHVLEHPFFGRITNAWLLNMRVVHQAMAWRACVYELRFKTEIPIGKQNSNRNFTQILNDSISDILSTASSINSIWATFDFVFNGNPQTKLYKNNIIIQNQVQNIQAPILESTNNTVNVTKILTSTLAPIGYNNVSLNKYVITTSTLPQLNYFNLHYTPQDINNMINVLTANTNNAISTIYKYGDNNYYDTIASLQNLISSTASYAAILLENYYGQVQEYKIPYSMSLFTACHINNIDYDTNYQRILTLNQGKLFWLNKLNKDDIILLPTVGI